VPPLFFWLWYTAVEPPNRNIYIYLRVIVISVVRNK